MWRNDSGKLSTWLSTGSGFLTGQLVATAPTDMHVAGIGDFNDDGKADILWRTDSGAESIWDTTATGYTTGVGEHQIDPSWHIIAHEFPL